jgi:hypothetical protein
VLLPSVDRCIRRDAFQNYLLQTKNRPGAALSIRAIKVAAIHDIFTRLSSAEYQSLMDDIALCVSTLTQSSDDVITHLGNGILLSACEGHSSLTKEALARRDCRPRVCRSGLRAHDLSLRVIVGEEFTVEGRATPMSCSWSRRPSKGRRNRKRSMSGWANFREWLSFRKSTGRERARIDQSAYEQILNEFIAEGELDWK